MDVDKLLAPLADYLDFVIDFLLFQGVQEFARLDAVSPKLLSFFVLSVLLGLVIYRAKAVPTFTEAQAVDDAAAEVQTRGASVKEALEQGDLLLFVPLLLIGTSVFHVSLLLTSSFTDIDHGTFKDSLNAALAGSAVQYPVQAALARAQSFAKTVSGAARAGSVTALLIHLLATVGNLGLTYYFFHAAATVHGLAMGDMWWPFVVFCVLTVLLIFFLGYLIVLRRQASVPGQKDKGG